MKKLLTSLLLTLLSVNCLLAYSFEVDGIHYNIISGSQNVEVISNYSKYSGSVVIPESVTCDYDGTTYSVTAIGDQAFFDCSGLTSVTIPNSVTSIGDGAFGGCSGLTSVTIPNSVTSIGFSAFNGCSGLTTPVYNNNVFAYMPKSYEGSYTIPDGIKSITADAFEHCRGLISVTIPNSVTTIGNSAFSVCSGLTSVTIGNSVTSIGNSAFSGCYGLTSLVIPNSVTSIGSSAFSGCSGLTSLVIPNSVTSIGSSAFSGCSGLTSLVIPNSVTSIGSSAFSGCSGLTSLVIPNSANSTGSSVLYGCSGLTSVSISPSMNLSSLYGCSGLKKIAIYALEPPAYNKNFDDVVFYVPSSAIEAYETAYGWKNRNRIFPMPDKFSVSVVSSDRSKGTVAGGGEYIPGAIVVVEATAEDGCLFVKWSDGNKANPRAIAIPEDIRLTAYFEEARMVSLSSNDNTMGSVSGGGEYALNEKASIEAIANKGYRFVQWSDGNTDNPRTITVTDNVTLTAEFEAMKYMVTVEPNDKSMGVVFGGKEYVYNSEASIAAVPNQGYRFVQWNDGNTDNPRTFTVTEDVTFTAEFEIMKFTVTTTVNDPSLGSVMGGNGEFAYNEEITIGVIPNQGCRFIRWNDGNTDNPRTITVTENITLTAEFGKNVKYNVNLSANDASMGSVTGGGEYYHNEKATIEATANKGCHFVKWSDGSTDNVRTITVTDNISLTAEFAKDEVVKYSVTVSSNDAAMGTVSGGGTYESGATATLTATANKGYHFVKWSDGNTDNPRTITVTDNISLTAEFAKDEVVKYSVTVSSNDAAMGTVSGGGTYESGATATLTATANKGYHFVKWSDGNTDNPRTITVTDNISLTAEFAKDNGTAVDNQVEDSIAVTAGNGVITVYGAEGETVTVYNMQGVCIYSAAGNDPTEVTVPVSGIYLVKVKDKTVKVSVR